MFKTLKEMITEWGRQPQPFTFRLDGKEIKYEPFDVGDEDANKTAHFVHIDGEEHRMDFSPYTSVTQKDIALWIKCGMPSRSDLKLNGPLKSDDLEKFAKQKGIE